MNLLYNLDSIFFFPTDARLSEYIFSYGLMEIAEGVTSPLLSPPNGLTGFLIRVASTADCQVVAQDYAGNPIAHQPSYVIGQITFPIVGYGVGKLTLLVVFFQPLGMYRLFGQDMGLLANKSEDLQAFLGQQKADMLMSALMQSPDTDSQIRVLNRFFLEQQVVKDACLPVKKALNLIHASQGNVSVNEIEKSCGVSRRTLERHFAEKIGISPKSYAQVYRFKCTINFLKENPETTWAELSNNIGYFDQPHLIRYFKEYLHVSPDKLVNLDLNFINYLLHH